MRANGADADLRMPAGRVADWVRDNTDRLTALLAEEGVAVLRAADPAPPPADLAAQIRDALGLAPVATEDEFADRTDLGGAVYSAPLWPGDREMCPHHERSYSPVFPGVVVQVMQQVPDHGGELVVADTAAAWQALPERLRREFAEHGWLLVRTYRSMLGRSWVTAFGTDDPDAVDRIGADQCLDVQWLRDGTLRTAGVRPAVVEHPATGRPCWFNQLTFFSHWAVDRAERELLLASFGADALPFNSARGDGAPLTERDFLAVLDAYAANSRTIDLRPGDVVLVDNIRRAHGRVPYRGERSVAVAPAAPTRIADLADRSLLRPGGTIGGQGA